MSPETHRWFRKSLIQRRKELADNSQHLVRALQTSELQHAIGSGRDAADFAVANHDEHLSGKRITYQTRIIREIDDALKRIDEGTFGCCEDCGDSILHDRLLAVPFAKFCTDCQEIQERVRPLHRDHPGMSI